MSENGRSNSSAMDKIIGNVTAEMQNYDGQYVSLGYSTPPQPGPPVSNNIQDNNWNNNSFASDSRLNFGGMNESQMFNLNQQFNYIQQPATTSQIYTSHNNRFHNKLSYENYPGAHAEHGFFIQQQPQQLPQRPHSNEPFIQPHVSNNTQLIENLVGNWVIPNNSGTYSPFGNKTEVYNLENPDINQGFKDFKPKEIVDDKFNFNSRDGRKPRMVAEVKPMRPTYSDILTKPVLTSTQQQQTKSSKNDYRDAKLKKESNKKKSNLLKQTPLNRSNTNNDFQFDKNQNLKSNHFDKRSKIVGQLDRKWASLDNISEPVKINSNSTSHNSNGGASSNGSTNNAAANAKLKKKDDDNLNSLKNSKSVKNLKSFNGENEANVSRSNENFAIKNGVKKIGKINRGKAGENLNNSGNERIANKRNQRFKRKENSIILGFLNEKFRVYMKSWWKIIYAFTLWLFQVISDICSLSLHIGQDFAISTLHWSRSKCSSFTALIIIFLKKIRIFTWLMNKFKKTGEKPEPEPNSSSQFTNIGLKHNLTMPSTGEEAMKRLLACKGKDPYSILGVTPSCTDDDIRKYYKRQAVLVHPDKNQQPGAEEAFKILVHAFDMIGVPERRAAYDRGVAESAQVEQAWSELTELLAQLQKKVEAAANTIRCSACGLRHKRVKIERPIYAARNCVSCKIHHAAREGDIWAEAQCLGFLWHYYACMEGGVYDITDWASCQKDSLKHIKSDSHHVQYRIALGKQNQAKRMSSSRNERPPDLENLLNSLYGGQSDSKKKNKKTK